MQVAGSEWSFGETQSGQTTAASALWLCCLPFSAIHMHMPMPHLLHWHTTDQLQWLVQWLHHPHHGGHTGTTPNLKSMKFHPRDNPNRATRIGLVASAPGGIAGVLVCLMGLTTPHLHTTGLRGLVRVWGGHGPKATCATIRHLFVPCAALTALLLLPIAT